MTRIVGAALIITASALIGTAVHRFFLTRASILEAFLMLIGHIESEIGGFLSPLDRIYASFRNPVLEKAGFLESLIKEGGVTALAECETRLYLLAGEKELLCLFFETLGRHGAEGEARHCAYYKSKLRELSDSASRDAASKKRLCISLSVLFGIMLSVILI